MRTGIRLTIFGPPNAGKSSLLNFLGLPFHISAEIVCSESSKYSPARGCHSHPGPWDDTRHSRTLPRHRWNPRDRRGHCGPPQDGRCSRAYWRGARKERVSPRYLFALRIFEFIQTSSVQAADIALCVVSCGDIDHPRGDENSVEFPSSVAPLITDDTFVLFNKIDLEDHDQSRFHGPHRWATSLKTGLGTTEFLDGFAKALQRRYHFKDHILHHPLIPRDPGMH